MACRTVSARRSRIPDRQVVCIVGDGGFTMLMGEIATLVKYNMNVKVIIIKNNMLGQIKWEQMVFEGNPEFGVDLQPIDFAGFAMNCGAAGFTIERPEDAEAVLREALAHRGPAVIEAVVDPNEPPMPGQVTTEQAIKFARSADQGTKRRRQDHQDADRGQNPRSRLKRQVAGALNPLSGSPERSLPRRFVPS